MYYSIRHTTQFDYSTPITESVMELYMQPRSDEYQHCLNFTLTLEPAAKINAYRDYLGNLVHHFDIPHRHEALIILAEALVELDARPELYNLHQEGSWEVIDQIAHSSGFYEYLLPGDFTQPTALLEEFRRELNLARQDNPFTTLRNLTQAIYQAFEYNPASTDVDSPIDDALQSRKGVCQDFTHIMLALGRGLGIPCRYVSGYLYYQRSANDRSAEDATHAWVEAYFPEIGWVGFDPTNNLVCNERHIRVAVGRDYAEVPPTKGVFKGSAESQLRVKVEVTEVEKPTEELELFTASRHPIVTGMMQQLQQQQ